MSERGYRIRNQQGLHFITFAVVEWVDVFTRQHYRDIVVESLIYCINNKGLQLHAWVIMSNHVHFIVSAQENFKLSDILRDFKKFTAIKIIDAIKKITEKVERIGCWQFLEQKEKKTVEIQLINFGGKTISR